MTHFVLLAKRKQDLGKKTAGLLASCEGGAPTANL